MNHRKTSWLMPGMVCLFVLALVLPHTAWSQVLPGDANGDGRISYADLTAIVNEILGRATSPGTPDCNSDGHVNIQDVVCLINILSTLPPPDPGEVAPPVDPTVATNLFTATEFLYTTGIQTGVAPGTIDPKRVAVLRGKVLDRDGNPLPSATISILNHPEFGQTLSRTDGMFDLAVNGGGYLTVKYQKSGYLDVQRQVNVPWQDYIWAPEVVLIPLDSQATVIDLAAATPFQVAQGSITNDERGSRQSTLLFPQGTQAEIVLPNGTTQPISNLTVRSTEYTTGENGPKAMPGELPPGVGYTYAVELSVDEAIMAGASEVRFNQPVIHYVENFLEFAAGVEVPAYYYDRKQGRWVPFPKGRVIKVLSITSNMADLDVDGDDAADSGTELTDMGITDAERQRIATLYPAGQSLWRVALLHFSPFDYNYGYDWPPDSYPPPPDVKPDETEDDPCTSQGSIIECQNQTLGESIGITGTPFTLNYRSDRVPGRVSANTLTIPLTGPVIYYQNIFLSVELEIEVAGRKFSYSYPPQPNLFHTFMWDGLDAYGRKVQGAQPISIRLGYKYVGRRCNGLGDCPYFPGTYDIHWSSWDGKIGRWDFSGRGLGGWSLNIQHFYNPAEKTLYLGTGERSKATAFGTVVTLFLDKSVLGQKYGVENWAASQAYFEQLTVAPDGSLYIADLGAHRVYRYNPANDTLTRVAGASWCVPGSCPSSNSYGGDGGPATLARLYNPCGVAFGPDGSYYIADTGNSRVRRVGTDGIITTVAGNGDHGYSGDGGPALNASLSFPQNLAIGPDGTIHILDGNNTIRRVSPDGIITTEAYFPDYIRHLALGPEGSLYYSVGAQFESRVFRLWPDGNTTVVAGNGTQGSGGDGGPATDAQLNWPMGLAVGSDNSLFIAEYHGRRVRRVGPDGVITTVAGGGPCCDRGGLGGPATAASLDELYHLALGHDGSFYVARFYGSPIYRVGPQGPGYSMNEIYIPSSDARQVYVFNSSGRHLRTIDALTQSLIYQFSYDSVGRLIQIADTEGNTTTIERNAAGIPTAIVSSYGQRTTFALNAGGYLSGITNPAGETTSFAYSGDGLMTGMTTPRGQTYLYSYDTLGRLTRDENPAGGFQALTRTELENGYEVSHATAMSRTTTYRVENLSTGDKRNVNLFPNGLQAEALYKTDGTDQTTFPDGTRTVGKPGPDPRFGMQAPIAQSFSVSVPSGLSITASAARTVTLSDPNNPLSLQTQNDTVTVNGQSYTSSYNGTTRRYTTRSPVGREFYTTLNEKGDVVEVQTLGYSSVRYLYDPSGRMTNIVKSTGTDERVTGFSYGTDGFLNQVVDPLNRTYGFIRDAAGRVQTYIPPDGSSVTYTYDQNGDVLTVMPPGRPAHSYTYTPAGLIGTYTAPAVGSENSTTQYAYNADQQLNTITQPDGKTISFAYDGSGRLSSMTLQEGTITPTYSPSTGALTTLASPGGVTLDFTYDGFLPTGEMWSGPVTGSVTRTYGVGLRMNSISVNGSQTIGLQYDQDGLLTQAGSLAISRSTQNDSITGTNLGAVSTSKTQNSFGELIGESGSYNTSTLFDIQYVRDKLGRILQKTETFQGSTDTYAYTYDVNGRLTGVRKNGSTISSYTYDENGNRTGANLGTPVTDISYDVQDRLIQYGGTTYTYTANGELLAKTEGGQVTTYQYDALGNLRQVTLPSGTAISYLIDGRNRRIGKRVDGNLTQGFLYENALKPIAELDGTNALRSLFIYGTRANVPDYMVRDGNTYRILSDHLGSPRLVVNTSTGEIAQRTDYDEFGNMAEDTNPGFQPFGFAGGLYDNRTGLLRFGTRDYDPRIGRWTTKDHEGFSQGSLNRYAYVDNDPVNWHDPDGQLRVDASSFPTTAQGKKLLEKVRAALRNLTGEKGEGDEWKSTPKKLKGERDLLDENYKEIWDKTVIRYDKNECGGGVGPGENGEWVITLGPLFEKERWKVIDLEKVILHEYLHPALKPGLRMGESFEHGTIDQIIKYDLRYPGAPNPAVGLI